nr:MAG TPA: hypothetical protein [Caudoviricetes sp.]
MLKYSNTDNNYPGTSRFLTAVGDLLVGSPHTDIFY